MLSLFTEFVKEFESTWAITVYLFVADEEKIEK